MPTIPTDLLSFLSSTFGPIAEAVPLSGIAGDGGAVRLNFTDGKSVIVKSSTTPRERNFYEHHADPLCHVGIGIATLYWSGCDDAGRHWISIEDIPNPFPHERWKNCDWEQIEMLFRLHAGTWQDRRRTLPTDAYQPRWDKEMTRRASEWFADGSEREHVVERLTRIQHEAERLFQPLCCISADPNPTNWRIRENGELVLIDWERFSYGHPAIDLGITMPGLGSKDGTMENGIAEVYRACWTKYTGCVPTGFDDLDRLIRVAKLWSVVEFLCNAWRKPELYPEKTVSYIVRELSEYID
ncbi:phosphotransferase family protein [Alicyclobacillus sp. ALC3]|uniref:phosphotransferase family protein n=1 Tax=Alicyclobacillus sp. ALC3 TaxID=2796143 RepID=UPI002378081B|nr:phosphotransferase [Alicyclobacillus sp. ALC3]WDL96459.1 phosphotransferase [Alicyclobacillus sp. ALC3]